MAKQWIQGAVKHKGSLTAAAKRHGKSKLQEAKAESHSPNKKIAARGRLGLRFMGHAKHGNLRKAKHKATHHKRVSKKA